MSDWNSTTDALQKGNEKKDMKTSIYELLPRYVPEWITPLNLMTLLYSDQKDEEKRHQQVFPLQNLITLLNVIIFTQQSWFFFSTSYTSI